MVSNSSSEAAVAPRARARSIVALAIVGSLALTASASASVLQGLTISQLRGLADQIVAGRVVDTRSVYEGGRVETESLIRVETAWRGERGLVRVRTAGGRIGDRRLVVPGAPSFARGERVLLFLYQDRDFLRPVGMFQGVWRVDADDPARFRASSSTGAVLVPPESGRAAVSRAERSLRQLVGRAGGEQ